MNEQINKCVQVNNNKNKISPMDGVWKLLHMPIPFFCLKFLYVESRDRSKIYRHLHLKGSVSFSCRKQIEMR